MDEKDTRCNERPATDGTHTVAAIDLAEAHTRPLGRRPGVYSADHNLSNISVRGMSDITLACRIFDRERLHMILAYMSEDHTKSHRDPFCVSEEI
jgi:hypothetical protein